MPPDGVLPMTKTIHQRNKSSPALSMAAAGTMSKTGAKRTAFGDVSNIVGLSRPSKDDSTLPGKRGLQVSDKLITADPEKKPLTRPAQRPMSVSNLRSLLMGSSSNNNNVLAPVSRSQAIENIQPQPANTRKVLSKRNTTIFKDSSLDTVQEIDPSTAATVKATIDQSHKLPPLPQTLISAQTTIPPPTTQPALVKDALTDSILPTSEASLPGIESVSLEPESLLVPTASTRLENIDPIKHQDPVPVNHEPQPMKQHDTVPALYPSAYVEPAIETRPYEITKPSVLPPTQEPQQIYYPAPAEPEEYWEEEEDEQAEEEGYVTARSFRSKGDTTGGATTVLFPQLNQRTRKEISAAKQLVEATRTREEVEDESYDTSMVAEYGEEIFDYMRQMEVKMLPNAHYMDNQHEIQWSMRSVLMDWLVQVHHRFNLLPETLFLCVNYIDRFLSCKVVSLGKLQLVGATAIFIAAKYEEINCPSVQEIVYMVDNGYSIDEILKAERFMLTMLQFELGWPGPMSFLRRISKADDYDLETRTLAKYFLEVTIMDERFIGSPPSFTAAASHCLARLILRKGTWVSRSSGTQRLHADSIKTPHHVHYSGYTFSQLRPLLKLLLECCDNARKHHGAVYNKYCDKRYKRASAFVETEVQRGFRLPELPTSKTFIPQTMQPFFDPLAYFQA